YQKKFLFHLSPPKTHTHSVSVFTSKKILINDKQSIILSLNHLFIRLFLYFYHEYSIQNSHHLVKTNLYNNGLNLPLNFLSNNDVHLPDNELRIAGIRLQQERIHALLECF